MLSFSERIIENGGFFSEYMAVKLRLLKYRDIPGFLPKWNENLCSYTKPVHKYFSSSIFNHQNQKNNPNVLLLGNG